MSEHILDQRRFFFFFFFLLIFYSQFTIRSGKGRGLEGRRGDGQ